MNRSIRRLAAALIVALALSACGDDAPAERSSNLAVTNNADVAELLGTPIGDDNVLAEFRSTHDRSEELIADCMADAGFEYEPAPFQPGTAQPVPVTETSLGIADQYFGAFRASYEPAPVDPNVAIFEALSADQGLLYNSALQGDSTVFDARFETNESIREGLAAGAVTQTGCRFKGQQIALAETGRNQDLIDDYRTLRIGLLQTEQRLARARVEWAQCMTQAGFTYRDEPAMREDVNGQAVAALQELVTLRDQGLDILPSQDPPPEAAELIDAVYAREAEVAGAHAECRVSIDAAIAEVTSDTDEIFLERNS